MGKSKIREILLGHACPGGSYDVDGTVEELTNLFNEILDRVELKKLEVDYKHIKKWCPSCIENNGYNMAKAELDKKLNKIRKELNA